MSPVEGIVQWARQDILSHKIESGPALMDRLASRIDPEAGVTLQALQECAVAQGLYRYLGERYLIGLDFYISLAVKAVEFRIIRSEAELNRFLDRASHPLAPFGRRQKVHNDLRIDARQRGIYALLDVQRSEVAISEDAACESLVS